jgi:hypothetical protein
VAENASWASFFIALPLGFFSSGVEVLREAADLSREPRDHLVQSAIPARVAKIGDRYGNYAGLNYGITALVTVRVRPGIGVEKVSSVHLRKVANLEHCIEVLQRDRHRIGGIRQLRNEGAIGAERFGKVLPSARWAVFENTLQNPATIDVTARVAAPLMARPRSD